MGSSRGYWHLWLLDDRVRTRQSAMPHPGGHFAVGVGRSWSHQLWLFPVSAAHNVAIIRAHHRSIRNIYPTLAVGDNKLLRLLVIGMVVLHAAVALLMKVFFFS